MFGLYPAAPTRPEDYPKFTQLTGHFADLAVF